MATRVMSIDKLIASKPRSTTLKLRIEKFRKSAKADQEFVKQLANMEEGWSNVVDPTKKSLKDKLHHVETYGPDHFKDLKDFIYLRMVDPPAYYSYTYHGKFEDYIKEAKNGDIIVPDGDLEKERYAVIRFGDVESRTYVVKLIDMPKWERYEGLESVFGYYLKDKKERIEWVTRVVASHAIFAENFTMLPYLSYELNVKLVHSLRQIITGRGVRVNINSEDLFIGSRDGLVIVGSSMFDVCYQYTQSILVGDLAKFGETVSSEFLDMNPKYYKFGGKSTKFYDFYNIHKMYSKEIGESLDDYLLMQVAIWLFNPGFTRWMLGTGKVWKLDKNRQDQRINEYWGANFAPVSVLLDSVIDLLGPYFRVLSVREMAKYVAMRRNLMAEAEPTVSVYGELNSDSDLFEGLVSYFEAILKKQKNPATKIPPIPDFDGPSHTAILVEMYFYILKCYELIRCSRTDPNDHTFIEAYTPKAFADKLFSIYKTSTHSDRRFIVFFLSHSVFVKEYKFDAEELLAASYIDHLRYIGTYKLPISTDVVVKVPHVLHEGSPLINTSPFEKITTVLDETPAATLSQEMINKYWENLCAAQTPEHYLTYTPTIIKVNPTCRPQDVICYCQFSAITTYAGETCGYIRDYNLCYNLSSKEIFAPEQLLVVCNETGKLQYVEILQPILISGKPILYDESGNYLPAYTIWNRLRSMQHVKTNYSEFNRTLR